MNSAVSLKAGAHIHFMGICGTAMASLAGLLEEQGFAITGSDQNFYPPMSTQLEKLKIPVTTGYRAENLNKRPDLVIIGNVISRDNPEAMAVMEQKIPYMSLPQAMSEFLIADRHSVVIAGTHGKTTTTSLTAWCADQAGLAPGFMVGGIPKNYNRSFQIPQKNHFVIEGDEYDTAFFDKVPKFVHYKPQSVILTSIEFDHADIYKDLDHVKSAFRRLLELIPQNGLLVYNHEDANIRDLLGYCKSKKVSFGGTGADVQVLSSTPTRDGYEFLLQYQGQTSKFFLPMFGSYNVANAAAVFALAKYLKWPVDIDKAFGSFQGVKRRQELIGQPRDIQIIEDFAHHPTAVEQTLATFRRRPGARKVHAVFEPRSATSRRNIFQETYAKAFSAADFIYIAKPFVIDKIPVEQRFSSEKLVEDLARQGRTAYLCETVADIIGKIKTHAEPGDTVIIMSNGGFDGIYQKLIDALQSS